MRLVSRSVIDELPVTVLGVIKNPFQKYLRIYTNDFRIMFFFQNTHLNTLLFYNKYEPNKKKSSFMHAMKMIKT